MDNKVVNVLLGDFNERGYRTERNYNTINMKSKLLYLLTYVGMWLLAVLPFPVLYALSDFIYFWLYHVIGYRRKVVRTNLKNSFRKSRQQN